MTKYLKLETQGENHIIDITNLVAAEILSANLENGVVTLFIPGSTAVLTTMEYEPGLLKDFPDMLERIAPRNRSYEHENMWHDGNGHSHVRASLLGPCLTIPFENRLLTLGTWQQIVFVELDIRARSRNVVLQIIGE